MKNIDLFIADVRKKRELSKLSDEMIRTEIVSILSKNKGIKNIFEEREYSQLRRSKEFEKVFKKVRADLRKAYGMFQRGLMDREELLNEIKDLKDIEGHRQILMTHQSTAERMDHYDIVYENIFKTTGLPEKILDLGCGLNPFSYPWLGCRPDYYASDVSPEDCRFIEQYFEKMEIGGEAIPADLNKISEEDVLAVFPHVDVCFLFKVLDAVITKPELSEKILSAVDADWIIASFSTVTLSGRPMAKKRRIWLEKLCSRLDYSFSVFETPNEIFYVIKKY